MELIQGDKVKHKKYDYMTGEVKKVSASGKRVLVRWPIRMFSAYYDPDSLELVAHGTDR